VSQGNRPNYQSTIQPLSYMRPRYDISQHEQFTAAAVYDLSEVTELDFEQPRALWQKVFDDGARERFINNVAGHISGAKSKVIVERQLSVFAAVDQDIADRLAAKLGHNKGIQPVAMKKASEAYRFQPSSKV